MRNKTFIIGCGRLGANVANESSSRGESVIVLDRDKTSFGRLDAQFSGITVTGNATSMETLVESGIYQANDLLIATGDDNLNLFLAHVCAKTFQVPHIYVRFNDPDEGLLVQGMNVKAIYPFQLSRARFNVLRDGGDAQ